MGTKNYTAVGDLGTWPGLSPKSGKARQKSVHGFVGEERKRRHSAAFTLTVVVQTAFHYIPLTVCC